VIDADSVQAKQIRPHILDAISSIDSLQKKTDDQVHTVLAAFEKNIEPLVTEEQMEQLRRFHSKARDPKD
jgi:hypothetical protein